MLTQLLKPLCVMLVVITSSSMFSLSPSLADAKTLRMALSDDATTLDLHVADLVVNNRLLHNIYEALVMRDKDFKLTPALAVSWSQLDAKTWRF